MIYRIVTIVGTLVTALGCLLCLPGLILISLGDSITASVDEPEPK